MNIPLIFWIVPAAAVIALAVAWAFYRSMKREDEGTPRMREIAEHVRKGAMAYLRQQYKVVLIVFIILALFFAYLAYGVGVQNPWVPFAFLTGGFFSGRTHGRSQIRTRTCPAVFRNIFLTPKKRKKSKKIPSPAGEGRSWAEAARVRTATNLSGRRRCIWRRRRSSLRSSWRAWRWPRRCRRRTRATAS